MKYLASILFLFFSLQLVYSQEQIESKQFMIGIDNVLSTVSVDHTIEPIGTYWEFNVTTQIWSISSDPLGESSTLTTLGESNFNNPGSWDGWNFFWLLTAPENEDWALGFYKVTNDYNSEYFYIDCRVDDFGQGRGAYTQKDFFVYLDALNDDYYYYKSAPLPPIWNLVTNPGDVVGIWDVHETNPPSSNSLPDYWDNVLVSIDDGNDHPRIAWGPYPDRVFGTIIGYKIYRSANHLPGQPGTFSLFATVDEDVFEYTDETSTVGTDFRANSYYIKCIYTDFQDAAFETSASNTVEIRLEITAKRSAQSNSGDDTFNYVLEQNYPNPFNPATIIQFSIKNKSFASLKIYDILGNEVAVLIENFLEAGNHSVEFNAEDLPSGMYMYQLKAEGISITRKMILLR